MVVLIYKNAKDWCHIQKINYNCQQNGDLDLATDQHEPTPITSGSQFQDGATMHIKDIEKLVSSVLEKGRAQGIMEERTPWELTQMVPPTCISVSTQMNAATQLEPLTSTSVSTQTEAHTHVYA
jgi:hypothetical protein